MNRILNYFALRMKQMTHDATALIFAFALPIAALLIGGFLSSQNASSVVVRYSLSGLGEHDRPGFETMLAQLTSHSGVQFLKSEFNDQKMADQVRDNKLSFFLKLSGSSTGLIGTLLYNKKDSDNEVFSAAILAVLEKASPFASLGKELATQYRSSYLDVFFPGMMGLASVIICLTGFGNYIFNDRRRGIFKKLKTIDSDPTAYLLGIILSRLTAVVFLFPVFAFIGVFLFSYQFNGSWILAFLLYVLLSLTIISIGLSIVNISKTVDAFTAYTNLVQLALVITGGVFFSLDAFPTLVREIFAYFPVSTFTSALQSLASGTSGDSFQSVLFSLGVLAVWSVVLLPLSIKTFKW